MLMSARSCALIIAIAFGGVFVHAAALVNINTADSTTLQTLSGIGPSKAQAIIDYRTQNGPFLKIEDIMNVSGIGTATYNNIKNDITVSDPAQASTQSETTQGAQTTAASSSASTAAGGAASQAVPSYVPPPVPEIFADGGEDRTVIVGADTEFVGRAYNRDKKVLDRVRFLWNFGDGTSADGPVVQHRYGYPGKYAVVLTIAEERYSVSDHIVVTAEPAVLSFSYNGDGSVTIGNESGRDLDLSNWIIRSFGRTFMLPRDTVVLSDSSIRIGHETLNFFAASETEFAYPNGVAMLHAQHKDRDVQTPTAALPAAPAHPPSTPSIRVEQQAVRASVAEPESTANESALIAAAAASQPAGEYWWLGALGFALIAGGGILAARRFKKDEWDIIEQND